jgi:hypothetical protein
MAMVGAKLCGVAALVCSGCSFIGERMPPAAGEHVERAEKRCEAKNIWFPIYDTASVGAGLSWVIYANQHLSKIDEQNAAEPAGVTAGGSDETLYKWERAGGYTVMGVWAASAVYGYIVEAKCAKWRHRGEIPKADADNTKRSGFPSSVYGFAWNVQPQRAEQLCIANGQEWHLEGTSGLCQSKVESVAHPDLKLEFELGAPAKITVIYRSAPAALNKDYAQLFASIRGMYGPPQIEPTRFSQACQDSLSDCLEHDEHPAGPVWHWTGGTVELAPMWQEDHALLELRYTREEPQAQ